MKLPHWLQLLLAFVTVSLAWVMQQHASGNLDLPAEVVTGVTVLNTLLGLFTNAVTTGNGPPKPPPTAGMAVLALMLGALFVAACLPPPKPVVNQVVDVTAAADCIGKHKGEPVTQIAGECLGSEVVLTEDLVADIEAIVEGSFVLAGQDPSGARAAFCHDVYCTAQVTAKVDQRRLGYVAREYAAHAAGAPNPTGH